MDHPLQSTLTRFEHFIRRFNDRNQTNFSIETVDFEPDAVHIGLFVPVQSINQVDAMESYAMNLFHISDLPRVIHHSSDGLVFDYIIH